MQPPPAAFADLDLQTRYHTGGSPDPLNGFYVPALSYAVGYDRVTGYFASSAFVTAAAGMARFVTGRGSMRLIAGAQLSAEDVEALQGKVPLEEALARRLSEPLGLTADAVTEARLQVIAWLVRAGRLEIRIGVPCDDDGNPLPAGGRDAAGYFHDKFGVLTDAAGDRIAFTGSVNETAAGWEHNYESIYVYPSWDVAWPKYGAPLPARFDDMWEDRLGPGWKIVALPEAVRDKLLKLVPDNWDPPARDPAEPPPPPPLDPAHQEAIEAIRAAPATATGVGLVSAGIDPWPHQMAIARRIVDDYPKSHLLADEVGLGKTIEIGLALRELLLSGRADTALVLVPASVMIQWQEELAEKLLLEVPRLDRANRTLLWPDGRSTEIDGNVWHSSKLLLASSHLARRQDQRDDLLEAPGWDVVVVDEAHHARRSPAGNPKARPNRMLGLLQAMRVHGKWRMLLAASATPMQMHALDLFDLLDLMGLPPQWRRLENMEGYFKELDEGFDRRNWELLRRMVEGFEREYDVEPGVQARLAASGIGAVEASRITGFAQAGWDNREAAQRDDDARAAWNMWLEATTPVADRVFRTTRRTLRDYRLTGVLDPATVIPERDISDQALTLEGAARDLYDAIDDYVRHTYAKYKRVLGKKRAVPVGWIMAIYRRRLTSSFHAVRRSLERRREALEAVVSGRAGPGGGDGVGGGVGLSVEGLFDDDDEYAAGDADLPESLADAAVAAEASSVRKVMAEEIAELDQILGGLKQLTEMTDREPKMAALQTLIREAVEAGHTKLVVFTQYADTLRFIRGALDGWEDKLVCYYGGRGERWDHRLNDGRGGWEQIGKEQVKARFRDPGDISIMVGTDSMSEGLNLQASDWLVNFDLPWNFTRVEQRIGRVDRIGGQPVVSVVNLMYADTIEERIFRRITECHQRFGDMLGPAAPVLSEHVIAGCMLGEQDEGEMLDELEAGMERLANAPLRPDTLDRVPHYAEDLNPAMTLDGLREQLFEIDAARARFVDHPDGWADAWLLELAGGNHPVTFNPRRYDEIADISLLTWGNPLLTHLLTELEDRSEIDRAIVEGYRRMPSSAAEEAAENAVATASLRESILEEPW